MTSSSSFSSWDHQLNASLNGLSVEEQEAIRQVLEKDLAFQQNEQNRIRSLSTCVQIRKSSIEKRRASSVAASDSSESALSSPGGTQGRATSPLPKWNTKKCMVCDATLGYILNSGTKCKKCSALLCEKCVIVSSDSKKLQLCPICHSERELSAAKNEWVSGSDEMTSQKLLQVMKTSTEKKRNSVQICGTIAEPPNRGGRAPYKRNLTLPSIQTNFLNVPDESPGAQSVGPTTTTDARKFWGGSPSPRSPRSFAASTNNSSMSSIYDGANDNLRAIHPREPIGSPAPRPMSITPLTGVPEDTDIMQIPTPSVDRRRSAFEGGSRRESRKFVEALIEFDRKRAILSIRVLVVRSEQSGEPTTHSQFMHIEIEFRRKSCKTSMRHKSTKRATCGEDVDKFNEIFKFPGIVEAHFLDAKLIVSCIISYPNRNRKIFEGKIALKELIGMRSGTKLFKFVELGNIDIYSIEEEETDEKYDWIISV